MFNFFIRIAFRNLWKKMAFSVINIVGLSLGIACCLIISFFIIDEFSYDRFHEKAKRIYRLTTHAKIGENTWNSVVVSPALGPVIVEEIPEVAKSVRLNKFNKVTVRRGDRIFLENEVVAADAEFLEVFSFSLLEGDSKSALAHPQSVLVTQSIVEKYFEDGIKVLGQTLMINNRPYEINGVLSDIPQQSHFHFDIVFSFQSLPRAKDPVWSNSNTLTYILLKEGTDISTVEKKIPGMMEKHSDHYRRIHEAGFSWDLGTQPITSIHLHSHLEDELEPNNYIQNVYIFILIALFILIIAAINFMNLSTARSADRAKEVGIRKTLGSHRSELIWQFLTESTLVALLALTLALGIVEFLKIPFQNLAGKPLSVGIFDHPFLAVSILLITILVGLAAGIYPAFYLSRFKPVSVLSGSPAMGNKGGWLRNGLVVFQFVISIGLIAGTIIIWQQLQYMSSKDQGLNKENVILIRNASKLETNYKPFIQSLDANPSILATSTSDFAPFDPLQGSMFLAEGRDEKEARISNFMFIDPDYLPTMGIGMLKGRNFSKDILTDSSAVVLNQAAVKSLGLEDPLNQKIRWDHTMQVIGITQDFHFTSLHDEIQPLVFMLAEQGDVIEARIGPQDIASTIEFIKEKWSLFSADRLPLQYNFLDSDFEALYHADQRLGKLFGAFSLLAILIACLGLFGLVSFITEQRTKEIGIRKILGASASNIVSLISMDFLRLVLLALVIATPLAWYTMNQWLANFAFRIELQWWMFLAAGVTAIIIALGTISIQSIKAAINNPVDSLRTE